MHKCPTCQRPFKKLSNEQRARTGVARSTGVEHEAARSLSDLSNACRKVHDYLLQAKALGQWTSGDQLRAVLNGGDGPRRARQLRDEFAVPIETKMMKLPNQRRQAYYRIWSALDNAFSINVTPSKYN